MERRKDNKGRVLKEGESQRKDGRYQYRYTDLFGKRNTIYATTLKELRDKEDLIHRNILLKNNPTPSKIKAYDALENYIRLRENSLKPLTVKRYHEILDFLKRDQIFHKTIGDISSSDAREWALNLYSNGYLYRTINNFKGIIKPAFDLAVQDNLILRNPFDYKLSNVIPKEIRQREALTNEQYLSLLEYIKTSRYDIYLDDIVILYETGLRISEFCALTFDDLDFVNDTVTVSKQIQIKDKKRFIQSPKSDKSYRTIPLSRTAKDHFDHLIGQRRVRGLEPIVDGVTGFISLTRFNEPKIGKNIQDEFRSIIKGYNAKNKDNPLPHVTPHVLRHCYCTNLFTSGMNIAAIQYLMGHSNIDVSWKNYTHISDKFAIDEYKRAFTKN